MTLSEFSNEFDVLFNNITSNSAPGLNGYEKSVLLTMAEKQLLKEYFNQRVDSFGGGFDGSSKRRYDFSKLMRVAVLYNVNTYADRITEIEKLDPRSEVFILPRDYFLSVNELVVDNITQYSVIPIDHAEYQRLMLKPYGYPVRKAAWRIITEKKNCNFCQEFVSKPIPGGSDILTDIDYVAMSTWADEKRNLMVTIKHESGVSYMPTTEGLDSNTGAFIFSYDGRLCMLSIDNTGWETDSFKYESIVKLSCREVKALDDEAVILALQKGFSLYADYLESTGYSVKTADTELAKVCRQFDGFTMFTAPSKFKTFNYHNSSITPPALEGRTFTTSLLQLPLVELIGRFNGSIQYKIRYVRAPKPIILEDLSTYGTDLSIDDISVATECELPEECHDEILERAVTLAKIAWQGGTYTQAQANDNKQR